MTPFAQLAWPHAYRQPADSQMAVYPYNRQPLAPAQPAAQPSGWTKGDTAMLAADIGIGSIPVVGGIWGLGRSAWDAAHGNWASAAGNLAMGGLGLFGLGGAAAAGKGAVAAGRLGMAARAANGIATAAKGTGLVAKGAKGLMSGGQTLAKAKAAGPAIGAFGKSTTLGNVGVHTGAYVAPSMVLSDKEPTAAPQPAAAAPAPYTPQPQQPGVIPYGPNTTYQGSGRAFGGYMQ